MAIWAIADLHLSFGVKDKQMDLFGIKWKDYTSKIEDHWKALISPDDLILIAGDISWAMRLEEARPDLDWIGRLPGTKVLIKGNHDFWWGSLLKIKGILPPSCHLIQNNSFSWKDAAIGGARLWDVPGLNFRSIIDYQFVENGSGASLEKNDEAGESQKIYQRELVRLETSLKSLNPSAKKRIVMTHYPPLGPNLEETEVTNLLEYYKVDTCVFGHLHNVKHGLKLFGKRHGINYYLTACDYLEDFKPLKISE